jgi:ATP adenylyltransferase
MNRKDSCCLCGIVSGQQRFGPVDKPFLDSEHFIAITSIGSFIEGWSLIVPKDHSLSCAAYYNDPEFLSFVVQTKEHIESIFGKAILFEHGASLEGSLIGCGVNHAHLHIVPFPISIEDQLRTNSLSWHKCSSSEIDGIVASRDYLYYIQSISKSNIDGVISFPEHPESQFFRKILAKSVGSYETFDYKKFPFYESSLKAHNLLATAN